MRKRYASLQRIDNDRKITKETDYEFLYHLQSALLLALRDRGHLGPVEYRLASQGLQRQRQERARCLQEKQ